MSRSHWGWGLADRAVNEEGRGRLKMLLSTQFDVASLAPIEPTPLADVELRAPRAMPPDSLRAMLTDDREARVSHCYGKAFRDVVRGLRGDFAAAPDWVAHPQSANDVAALLDWCADARMAAIPYGGGSSVVGGVEARDIGDRVAALSIDLGGLSGLHEVDAVSRAARIGAGTYGPAIEAALREHDLTLRHFPQSFEFSTLGGWLATRAGGHFATLHTHIDDFCQAMTTVTPTGIMESRRLPASGAGPSPDRLMLGSEGTLGIIVDAWMRVQPRPTHRASKSVAFTDFLDGARAVRMLAQSGLHPANCRLLDAREALVSGVGDGETSYLLVAFESSDHPVDAKLARALELARDAGGKPVERASGALVLPIGDPEDDGDAAKRWRKAFLRAPYLRDALVRLGAVTETFETAITWDRFEAFHHGVTAAVEDALARECGGGMVSCRFTHAYPDGVAPYYTVIAPGRGEGQVPQWDAIKAAASEAIIALGGTITHHHAVGRDHRPWYDQQRPEPFARALGAAKKALDPAGVLNPGVLIDA